MGMLSLAALLTFTGIVGVASLSGPGQLTKDFCACRVWRKEYGKKKSICGKGFEYPTTYPNAPRLYRSDTDEAKKEICTRLYYKLDTNHCVNMATGKDNGTWCYTDVRCEKLNGGKQIDGQLRWKKCQGGGRNPDLRLRDMSPEDLEEYAKHKDVWLGGLVRVAYPGSRSDQNDLVKVADFNGTIPAEVIPKLKELGNGDEPIWFDTNANASVPIVIVHGKKAWKIDKRKEQHRLHPGTWSELTCLVGC